MSKISKKESKPTKPTLTQSEEEQKVFSNWINDVRLAKKHFDNGLDIPEIGRKMRWAESWVKIVVENSEEKLIYDRLKSGCIPKTCLTDQQKEILKRNEK